jgi:uncharacterized protein YhhL (DUF1145 family)
MSRKGLHPDVAPKEESVLRGVGRACVVTIWGVVVLGYVVCFAVEQYYRYSMYYGMIVFLFAAVVVTIPYTIGRTIGWLMGRRTKVITNDQ